MADEPVPKEERDRVFRKLLAKADNRTCFDCPQRKPIWASSTFGVFICLDCAGGQRRLGTHLTFCLLYTSPSPRDATLSRMPSSA